jgi:hypothetical protein
VLIRHLPANDSALHRKMDPEGYGWTVEAYLLAEVGDLINAGNWQRGNAGVQPGSQSPRPQPMYRPPDPHEAEDKRLRQEAREADWRARHCKREDT